MESGRNWVVANLCNQFCRGRKFQRSKHSIAWILCLNVLGKPFGDELIGSTFQVDDGPADTCRAIPARLTVPFQQPAILGACRLSRQFVIAPNSQVHHSMEPCEAVVVSR